MKLLPVLLCLASPVAAQSFGSPTHFTEQGGAAVYRGICAGCHMADGRGAVGAGVYPSLAADANLADSGRDIAVVLHGARAMPGFARSLSDQQIADVVAYIRTSFGNHFTDSPTAQQARSLR